MNVLDTTLDIDYPSTGHKLDDLLNDNNSTMAAEFFRKVDGALIPSVADTDYSGHPEGQSSITSGENGDSQLKPKTDPAGARELHKVDNNRAIAHWLTTILAPRARTERFDLLQKWEGVVTDVGDETFVAELITISGDEEDMIAEIYLKNVHEDDRELVEPGAIFYWSIGYLRTAQGTTKRKSDIRFRRLPRWTRRQLKKYQEQS